MFLGDSFSMMPGYKTQRNSLYKYLLIYFPHRFQYFTHINSYQSNPPHAIRIEAKCFVLNLSAGLKESYCIG